MYIFAITDEDYKKIKTIADKKNLLVIDYIKIAIDKLITEDLKQTNINIADTKNINKTYKKDKPNLITIRGVK